MADGGAPAAPDEEADGGGEGVGAEEGARVLAAECSEIALPSALKDDPDFAAVNQKNKSIGAEWVLTGCPLRDLVLTRVTMEPPMAILRKQLHQGSHRWEVEQDSSLLGDGEGRRRQYRLLACARGELDVEFAQHQQQVFWSAPLFALVPPSARTEQFSCLAFRMATRVGAEYERLLASRHRKPPFTLFLATQSQQVALHV